MCAACERPNETGRQRRGILGAFVQACLAAAAPSPWSPRCLLPVVAGWPMLHCARRSASVNPRATHRQHSLSLSIIIGGHRLRQRRPTARHGAPRQPGQQKKRYRPALQPPASASSSSQVHAMPRAPPLSAHSSLLARRSPLARSLHATNQRANADAGAGTSIHPSPYPNQGAMVHPSRRFSRASAQRRRRRRQRQRLLAALCLVCASAPLAAAIEQTGAQRRS